MKKILGMMTPVMVGALLLSACGEKTEAPAPAADSAPSAAAAPSEAPASDAASAADSAAPSAASSGS